MYLTDYIDGTCLDKSVPRCYMDGTTYVSFFKYWREKLFEKVMHLFKWSGTGEVYPKEIEKRLLLSGIVGICEVPEIFNTRFNSRVTAMWASMFDVTKYEDEYIHANVRCPIWTGTKTIDKDIVIINNDKERNPLIHVVTHYAQLLAHNEVTIVLTLINARDAGGVPTASTEKQKQSLNDYYKKLYNGKFGVVTDVANLNVEFIGSDRKTMQNIKDLFETRSAIIKAFYSDIGIRSAFEKNNNTVTEEVISDTSQLVFNLTDMLDCRKEGAEKVNAMFGTNWNVDIAKEINYVEMGELNNENNVEGIGTSTGSEE